MRHNNYKYCDNCRPKQRETNTKIGQKFGKLTVIKRHENNIQPNGETKVVWECLCDCGNIVYVMDSHLKSGHTTSCGCFHLESVRDNLIKDITGQKFGKLTPFKKAYIKNGRQYWYCNCECGNTCIVSCTSLTTGKRKSCGCLISVAEHELEQHLKENHINYKTQYRFNDCKDKKCLPFDFVIFDNAKNIIMAVELNGEQHYHPFTYCGEDDTKKLSNLKDRQKKDQIKREYCSNKHIPLLEIRYTKFYKKEKIFDDFYNKLGDKNMYNFNAEKATSEVIKWIRNLFAEKFPNNNCCIALSGGKDSSIVAALCVAALGKDRVKGIMLPQHEQSDINCSILCANMLGIEYKVINIGETVDSIIFEMESNGIIITEQARINVPARVRMTELYFYAQCNNGIPSCNCNLSEDWIGYATYGGDGFGSFAPIGKFTVTEVKAVGYVIKKILSLSDDFDKLIDKIPADGLCGKTDEDNLGFPYYILDKYIRTGEIEDLDLKAKIDLLHEKNLFKLQLMPTFEYKLTDETALS